MGDYHHLPILPASSSLSSHLQALDLLAARLHSLNTQAEWETRVPLNSKASVKGAIVNTANVKINIGGEWWVNMTPLEGEEWVRRRKTGMSLPLASRETTMADCPSLTGRACESPGRLEARHDGKTV
jgi:prefoldin subunit 5